MGSSHKGHIGLCPLENPGEEKGTPVIIGERNKTPRGGGGGRKTTN